jgi:hypothetical protein
MTQSAKRFQPGATRQSPPFTAIYANWLGSFVDTVLRGFDRIFGGLTRPALEPVPARVPSSGRRRRA